MIFSFELPLAPTQNSIWRIAGKGMHRSTKYVQWQKECLLLLKTKKIPFSYKSYNLIIEAKKPDKRRRDIDNIIKPVNDLLEIAGVIENDCFCMAVTARWVTDIAGMRITIGGENDLH